MGKWSYEAAEAREPEETGAIGAMRAAFEARGWEFGCLEFETSKGETRVEVELFDPDAPPGAIAEVYASVPKGSEADAFAWRDAFSDKLERLLPRATSAAPAAAARARLLAEGYGEAMADAQALMGLPAADPLPGWAAAVRARVHAGRPLRAGGARGRRRGVESPRRDDRRGQRHRGYAHGGARP